MAGSLGHGSTTSEGRTADGGEGDEAGPVWQPGTPGGQQPRVSRNLEPHFIKKKEESKSPTGTKTHQLMVRMGAGSEWGRYLSKDNTEITQTTYKHNANLTTGIPSCLLCRN